MIFKPRYPINEAYWKHLTSTQMYQFKQNVNLDYTNI